MCWPGFAMKWFCWPMVANMCTTGGCPFLHHVRDFTQSVSKTIEAETGFVFVLKSRRFTIYRAKLCDPRFHLAEWHRKTELLGRYLSPEDAMDLQRECDGCLTHYLVLSHMAVNAGELLFPIRPKLHVASFHFNNFGFLRIKLPDTFNPSSQGKEVNHLCHVRHSKR